MICLAVEARSLGGFAKLGNVGADRLGEGAKVIKRYHAPATPYARALSHPKVGKAVKRRLRELYRTLDPVALLSDMRAAQAELGDRIDRRGKRNRGSIVCEQPPVPDAAAFAKALGRQSDKGEPRATHRRIRRPYKTRVRMPSMLDPHLADIESWLTAEPKLTALAILGRLSERAPAEFGPPQHSIVQRMLKTLRAKSAHRVIAAKVDVEQSSSKWPPEANFPSNIPP